MITRMPDLPDNVLALEASGEVTGEDYETVVIPAVEKMLAEHDKLRMLYQLGPDYTGFEGAAMWDDTKVGMRHLTRWEKIAVVTDVEWMAHTVKAFGFLMPGEVQVFSNAELAAAKAWVAA